MTDDGLRYYAMELLDGEDLACAVERQGPLSQERCVSMMLKVSGALAEAHTRGMVHRDIKPANVFLCRGTGVEDFVKVLDFGIAKRSGCTGATELTLVGRVLGTPAYVSPEAATGSPADARSDVYGAWRALVLLTDWNRTLRWHSDSSAVCARVRAPDRAEHAAWHSHRS